jgi:uncharacterized protein
MAVALSYPGVYVQEIPSGVHAIAGVATSITAFVGRAARGPEDQPIAIKSFGDFQRAFGGLWLPSILGFAVRDFFLNGGAQAIVVRVYAPDASQGAAPSTSTITVGGLKFKAASKGAWGGNLRTRVDLNVSADLAKSFGLATSDLFNLSVREVDASGAVVNQEIFRNLSVKDSPRRVDKVLAAESSLLRWGGDAIPSNSPPAIPAGAGNGGVTDDDVTAAQATLAQALAATPQVPADIAKDQTAANAALAAVAASDGVTLTSLNFLPAAGQAGKKGLYALENADLFNLLCIPPYTASSDVDTSVIAAAAAYCETRRAILLVDSPSGWVDKATALTQFTSTQSDTVGTRSKNAALFFPRLLQPNPLRGNQIETYSALGAVAGVIAQTDANRGVWKAPAGIQASIVGASAPSVPLTNAENGDLNQVGVNCLRAFPVIGNVVWGARTLRGADLLADEYKYLPVRRTALFIEESLYRGLQWAVFEPNDGPLWAQIRLNVGAFMQTLFRQGAFQGSTPRDAYFVKCDSETTTQNDINLGVVNVVVGFAPLKPAEFVVISLQQIAGQIAV